MHLSRQWLRRAWTCWVCPSDADKAHLSTRRNVDAISNSREKSRKPLWLFHHLHYTEARTFANVPTPPAANRLLAKWSSVRLVVSNNVDDKRRQPNTPIRQLFRFSDRKWTQWTSASAIATDPSAMMSFPCTFE